MRSAEGWGASKRVRRHDLPQRDLSPHESNDGSPAMLRAVAARQDDDKLRASERVVGRVYSLVFMFSIRRRPAEGRPTDKDVYGI